MLVEEGVIEDVRRWKWGLERDDVWQCVQQEQKRMVRYMEHELWQLANHLADRQYDYFLMSDEERRQHDLREEQRYIASGGTNW